MNPPKVPVPGTPIGLKEGANKWGLSHQNVVNWIKAGVVAIIGWEIEGRIVPLEDIDRAWAEYRQRQPKPEAVSPVPVPSRKVRKVIDEYSLAVEALRFHSLAFPKTRAVGYAESRHNLRLKGIPVKGGDLSAYRGRRPKRDPVLV
jgi:hypothetical protein